MRTVNIANGTTRDGGLRGLYKSMFKASESERHQIFGKEGRINPHRQDESKALRSSYQSADYSNQSRVLQILESIGKEEEPFEGPASLNEAIQQYKDTTGKERLETQEKKQIEQDFTMLLKQRSDKSLRERAKIDVKVKKLVGQTHRQVRQSARIDNLFGPGASTSRTHLRGSNEIQGSSLQDGGNYNTNNLAQKDGTYLFSHHQDEFNLHLELKQVPAKQVSLLGSQDQFRPLTQRDAVLHKNLMTKYERRTVKDFDPQKFNLLFAGASSKSNNLQQNAKRNNKNILPSLHQRASTHRASQKPSIQQAMMDRISNGEESERSHYQGSSTVCYEKNSEKQIANDFIDPITLATINKHKVPKSTISGISRHRNISTRGSIAGPNLSYVNPDEIKGEKLLKDFRNWNQRNQINGLYWEFQNQEIREYDRQKLNEKQQMRSENQVKAREEAKRLSKNVQQPAYTKNGNTFDADQSSMDLGNDMKNIYKVFNHEIQHDGDSFTPDIKIVMQPGTKKGTLRNSQDKAMNAFGEILESLDKHCSTTNIQVRNNVEEFNILNSGTHQTSSVQFTGESASSKKVVGSSQMPESKISIAQNTHRQNQDLTSDLFFQQQQEFIKPITLQQSRNNLGYNKEPMVSGEDFQDILGGYTRNDQQRTHQMGSLEISTQTLAGKAKHELQFAAVANQNSELLTPQQQKTAPRAIRIPEALSSNEGSVLPHENSAYLRLSLEVTDQQASVATERRATAVQASPPIYDKKPVVSVTHGGRQDQPAQTEVEHSGKARQVFKKLSLDNIEREISELQDLQMLDQINELEEAVGQAQSSIGHPVQVQVVSIEPSAQVRKVKVGHMQTERRILSRERGSVKDRPEHGDGTGSISKMPKTQTARREHGDQEYAERPSNLPGAGFELVGSSHGSRKPNTGLQTMPPPQRTQELLGLGDRRGSKGFQFLGVPQRLREQHVSNRQTHEQKQRTRGLKELQIREALEAEQKQSVKITCQRNSDIQLGQIEGGPKQQHVLVQPAKAAEVDCESANSTKLEVIVQHSSKELLDRLLTLPPKRDGQNMEIGENDTPTGQKIDYLSDASQESEGPKEEYGQEQKVERATLIYKDFEPPTGFRGKKMAKNELLLKQHLLKPELGHSKRTIDDKRPYPVEVATGKNDLLAGIGPAAQESPAVESPAKLDHHLPAKFAAAELAHPTCSLKGSKRNRLLFGNKKSTTQNLAPWPQQSSKRVLPKAELPTPLTNSASEGLGALISPSASSQSIREGEHNSTILGDVGPLSKASNIILENQQHLSGAQSVPRAGLNHPSEVQLCSFQKYVEEHQNAVSPIFPKSRLFEGSKVQNELENGSDDQEKPFEMQEFETKQMKDTSCQGHVETSQGEGSSAQLDTKSDGLNKQETGFAQNGRQLVVSNSTQLWNGSKPTMNDSASIQNIQQPRFCGIQVTTQRQTARKKVTQMVSQGSQIAVVENNTPMPAGIDEHALDNSAQTMRLSPPTTTRRHNDDGHFGKTVFLSPNFGSRPVATTKNQFQEYPLNKTDISGFAVPFVAHYNSKQPQKLAAQSQRGPRPYRQVYGGGHNTKPKKEQSSSSKNQSQTEEIFELRKKVFEKTQNIVSLPAIPSFPKRQAKLKSQQKLYPLSGNYRQVPMVYDPAKANELQKIDECHQTSFLQTSVSRDHDEETNMRKMKLNIFKKETPLPGRSENNTIFEYIPGSQHFKSQASSEPKSEDATPNTVAGGKKTTISSQLTAKFKQDHPYLEDGADHRNDAVRIQATNTGSKNLTAGTPMSLQNNIDLGNQKRGSQIVRKEKSNGDCMLK